jgi:hypothetical protein
MSESEHLGCIVIRRCGPVTFSLEKSRATLKSSL